MTQPESRLQQRIVATLEARGWFAMRQRLVGRRGWPDLYAILPCRCPCHLEVKRPGRKPAPLQWATLAVLRKAGAVVGVVESSAAALSVIEAHLESCPRFGGA